MNKIMAEETDNKVTQLRKGILELAVMAALYRQSHYGYSLVRGLAGPDTAGIKEGTVYPILARLAREGLVRSEWVESSQGPPRKYYELTAGRPGRVRVPAGRVPPPGAAGGERRRRVGVAAGPAKQ